MTTRIHHRLTATAGLLAVSLPFALAHDVVASGEEEQTEQTEQEEPAVISLTGIVRDFKESNDPEGHVDFERKPDKGFGHYSGNVAPTLDDQGKPYFVGPGFKVKQQWRDELGNPICYCIFDEDLGDVPGLAGMSSSGGIHSADSLSQWFRDVPGVNVSQPLTLKFLRQEDGSYVFDDTLDPAFQQLGGFFPIEDQLFGNPGGEPDRNFHFTFELHTTFTYQENEHQMFRFIGDDDVWVFVNNQLVIDLGGVHPAEEQYLDLDRLGLVDGETYPLDFFFAERHRVQSNFRIVTTLNLQSAHLPEVSAAFD